ncbi:hypothetical protein [Leifsonia shinshuensis]|uniref:hypothetical protein n=1 Tax=Leifsonia shinshuensis TaxID=150026 RepID=UPI00285D1832|nr:hypothetical protein [Leifsonia shinshuensis]MDR6969793.1 hypothetical protein [Leifsonia shinshuensis]
MNGSRLRPRPVLWWGIGLTLGGVLLTLLLPQLGYTLTLQHDASTGVDQGMLVGIDLVVRVVAQVVPPLGVALIGASLVMTYVGRLLTADPSRRAAVAGLRSTPGDDEGAEPVV